MLEDKKPSLATLLEVGDIASDVRRQREQVDFWLNIDIFKDDFVKRLLANASAAGETLTEEDARKSVDIYLERQYSFEQPKHGFSNRLANLYVNRGRIFDRYVKPALATVAVIGFLAVASAGAKKLYYAGSEARVESAVEENYQKREDLTIKLRDFSLLNNNSSESNELRNISVMSARELDETKIFFAKYCDSNGSADDKVTRENYKDVRRQLNGIETALGSVEGEIARGDLIIDIRKEYETALDIAVQGIAKREVKSLYSIAKNSFSDVPKLREIRDALVETQDIMKDEFTVRIVQREGEYSLIFGDYGRGTGTSFYAIVEAVNSRGRVVPYTAMNTGNGMPVTLNVWAEQIPESVYERLKEDKLDDGIIADNIFAVKPVGFLADSIVVSNHDSSRIERGVQLNNW